jgi:hypothetical protein
MSSEPKKMPAIKDKFSKWVKEGDKVAIIGTVREIVSQNDSVSLHLVVENQMPIVISPNMVEKVG